MELIFDDFLQNIDVLYIILCNICTYIFISAWPKGKELKTGWKRLISAVMAFIIGWIMVERFNHPFEQVFYGFFIQFLMYDYVLKVLFKKLDVKPDQKSTDPPEETVDKPTE